MAMAMKFSDGEVLAIKILVRGLAESCREDIIGGILNTGAFHALADDNGKSIVALANKLEMTKDEDAITNIKGRIKKGQRFLDYGKVRMAKAEDNARG
jgi:hypothetical protein